jgi:hypothetical protein
MSIPLPYFTEASRIQTEDGLGIGEGTAEATTAIPNRHRPQRRAARGGIGQPCMVPAFPWISRDGHRPGAEGLSWARNANSYVVIGFTIRPNHT